MVHAKEQTDADRLMKTFREAAQEVYTILERAGVTIKQKQTKPPQ